MKIFIKLLLIIVVCGVIGLELYWYSNNGGNLIVLVQNQSDQYSTIETEVLIDDTQIFNDFLKEKEVIPKEIILTKGIGKHKITIVRKDSIVNSEEEFFLFFVKWITVDIYSNKVIIEHHLIPPLFQ